MDGRETGSRQGTVIAGMVLQACRSLLAYPFQRACDDFSAWMEMIGCMPLVSMVNVERSGEISPMRMTVQIVLPKAVT